MQVTQIVKVKNFGESWRFRLILKLISKLGLVHEVAKEGTITIFGNNFNYDPKIKIKL